MSDNFATRKRGWRRIYPTVNVRIIAPFLLAIIVIAGIGVFIVTQLVAGSIQERFNNQLVDSANSAANTIVDFENDQLAMLRQMVFTEGIPEAILGQNVDDLDLALRPLAANNGADEIIVFGGDAEPILYLSRLNTLSGVDYGTPEFPDIFQWESVQSVITRQIDNLGDKYVDTIDTANGPVFYFSAPVIVEDNPPIGGIIVGIRANNLVLAVSQQALSSVTLTDPTGRTLATTFRTTADDLTVDPVRAGELMAEVVRTSPVEQIQLDGVDYQILYSPFRMRSKQIGLLSVGLRSDFIVDRSSASRNQFGILFIVLFVVVGLMGMVIARTITGPIRRLVTTTRAIREGDLSRRVRLRTPDELGELGESFDHMTDNLVTSNQQISALYDQQVQVTAQREAVLTSISDAVIVQDTQGKIILRNHTAEQLMEALASDREQRNEFARLCLHPEELATPRMAEFVEHYFSVLATPVQMEAGDLLGYVIVFRDITAIIQSEKLKDEMVLQMSHELRTPLAAIRGYVDLVKMFDGANITEQSLGFIESATDNLTTLERLVNQVIDVSAMISNRFSIDFETFNLAYLLQNIAESWIPIMKKRNLRFSLALPTSNMWIEGDERRISEVIESLLRNAYSYTLEGGMVELHAEMTTKRAIISVADSGVGIGEDEINKVFERMYRGRSADAGPTDSRGMGLGLYIARQIVEAHHGSIIIESQPDLGTIVTVGIPVRLKEEPQLESGERQNQ